MNKYMATILRNINDVWSFIWYETIPSCESSAGSAQSTTNNTNHDLKIIFNSYSNNYYGVRGTGHHINQRPYSPLISQQIEVKKHNDIIKQKDTLLLKSRQEVKRLNEDNNKNSTNIEIRKT